MMRFPRESALQRIQVGLIGLVVVLLFVSLANLAIDRAQLPPGDTGGATSAEIAAQPEKPSNEPLVELGVAPVTDNPAQATPPTNSPKIGP